MQSRNKVPSNHFESLPQKQPYEEINIQICSNKYSSAGHHEQKNIKTTNQIKFSAVTIKQQIKLVLRHSLCK